LDALYEQGDRTLLGDVEFILEVLLHLSQCIHKVLPLRVHFGVVV
jgi:hypothetical protein